MPDLKIIYKKDITELIPYKIGYYSPEPKENHLFYTLYLIVNGELYYINIDSHNWNSRKEAEKTTCISKLSEFHDWYEKDQNDHLKLYDKKWHIERESDVDNYGYDIEPFMIEYKKYHRDKIIKQIV